MPKLITHDRYEGCDPQIAEALKNHQMVKGKAYDGANEQVEAELTDYCNGLPRPYFCLVKGLITQFISFPNFSPSYEEETDWSKIEVDDHVIIDQDGEQLKRHFAKFENGSVYTFNDGLTSFTATNGETTAWIPCQCRLAKERK